jgi:hypothetical protein
VRGPPARAVNPVPAAAGSHDGRVALAG